MAETGKFVLCPMYYLLCANSTPLLIGTIFASLLILSSIGFHDSAHAQTTSEPVQLEEIVVTPGKFTVQDGTDASLSLSKEAIDLFPLIDNDVFRSVRNSIGILTNAIQLLSMAAIRSCCVGTYTSHGASIPVIRRHRWSIRWFAILMITQTVNGDLRSTTLTGCPHTIASI